MAYTKKDELIDRIKDNYDDFKISLRGVSRTKLFAMAGHIAAITEAYEFLTSEYVWDEEGEIDFFLLFRDPLTVITDVWENRRNDMTIDLHDAMFDASFDDSIIADYPLIEGVVDDIVYIGNPDGDRLRSRSDI